MLSVVHPFRSQPICTPKSIALLKTIYHCECILDLLIVLSHLIDLEYPGIIVKNQCCYLSKKINMRYAIASFLALALGALGVGAANDSKSP